MTQSNEIKSKAVKLISTVNVQAASSLESFVVRFPEIEQMMLNRTTDDWIYYMTIGGTAAAVMMNRKLTGEESTEIAKSLSDWNKDASMALGDLLEFIDTSVKSGVDHFAALGLWVWNRIIDKQPSTEDTTIPAVVGIFLRDSFKDSWDST